MGYRSGYQRSNYRRSGTSHTVGRVLKPNRRPGACRDCGEDIPAGAGNLYREPGGTWSVVHIEPTQGGWLMHPQPVRGGCPESTDKRNAESYASGFFGPDATMPRSEREHIAELAARYAASSAASPVGSREAPRDRRGGYLDECGSCGMASCAC
jgi:hypothetical protein